jgi:D-sedoheptulose 7-phosphate isomerase
VIEIVRASLREAAEGVAALASDEQRLATVARAGEALAERLAAGGKVISCGNGGSMSDAMHFAEELTGRYRDDRPPIAAMAVSDPGHLSCTANDYGYEQVFARYVEAHARPGDALVAISTSGRSPNVLRAAEAAKARDTLVVALTGRPGSALADLADIEVCTPAGRYADRVQELHITVLHIFVEIIERRLAGGAAGAAP